MTEVRQVRIRFPGDVLVWFLHDENEVRAAFVRNGLPPTARFVRCWNDEEKAINLAFEDESFALASDDNLPILVPVFLDMRAGPDRRSGLDRRQGERRVPK